MARYIKPTVDILYFDEEEIEMTLSGARHSSEFMNEYFFGKDVNATRTTTVKLQNVNVTAENN